MSEEELEKALNEIFKEDTQMIRERMKVLMRGYDKALTKLVEKDKVIDLMAEQLAGLTIFDMKKEEPLILGDKEEVKEYFYKKAEGEVE